MATPFCHGAGLSYFRRRRQGTRAQGLQLFMIKASPEEFLLNNCALTVDIWLARMYQLFVSSVYFKRKGGEGKDK